MNGALKINRAGLDFGLLILVLCVLSNFSYGFETLDPNYMIPGVITDSNTVFTIPSVAKPDYGVSFVDSTFGTRVTRIVGDSNTSVSWEGPPSGSGTWGLDARHHYSKDQPWNADGTLIAIQNNGTAGDLYLDGHTYKPRYKQYSGKKDDRWHPKLPNVRINVNGTTLEWVDVTTGTRLRTWTLPFSATFGPSEGNPSFDGRFVVLSTSNASSACVVDMDPQPPLDPYPYKRIGPVYTGIYSSDGSVTFDWASVSPSGKYCVATYGGVTSHLRVFDINPDTLVISPRPMPTDSLECNCHTDTTQGWIYHLSHADMTLNPFDSNEDVIVGQIRSQTYCPWTNKEGVALGGVVMVRLKDNKVIRGTIPGNEAQPHHISTRDYYRPGWAYASYYTSTGKRFTGEVIAVKLDGSGTVERYVHHHSYWSGIYRAEVHPVPSPDGRRVIFASDWYVNCGSGCGTTTNFQDYVMETTPVGDLTHSGSVDMIDLAKFADNWLSTDCITPDWCSGADLDTSGSVSFQDLKRLTDNWLGE